METSTLAPLSARTPPLSRKRKAAMIVQLLIGDGGKLKLSQLPEDMQALLARELGAIRLVDRETVHQVAAEFARDLGAVGLSSPGGADGAIDALSEHLSPELANRLRAELASAKNGDPWTLVLALPDEVLLLIMTRESPEVCAVALSKLTVMKAAIVLEKMPGDQARRITYAISQTENIAPDAVRRIGAALVPHLCFLVRLKLTTCIPRDERFESLTYLGFGTYAWADNGHFQGRMMWVTYLPRLKYLGPGSHWAFPGMNRPFFTKQIRTPPSNTCFVN